MVRAVASQVTGEKGSTTARDCGRFLGAGTTKQALGSQYAIGLRASLVLPVDVVGHCHVHHL